MPASHDTIQYRIPYDETRRVNTPKTKGQHERPRKRPRAKPFVIAIILVALMISVPAICVCLFREPEPVPAHAIYKLSHWNAREATVQLLEYGDTQRFRPDGSNSAYALNCEAVLVWHDHETDITPKYQFTITAPDKREITGICGEPTPIKNQERCVIVDTGHVRYYVAKGSLRLTNVEQ